MLTLEQEQKSVNQFTKVERKKALIDYQRMLNDVPEKSILKLINTKSGEFGIKPEVLFNNLIDILFLKLTFKKIPENLKKYNYTEKWFSYYLCQIIKNKPFNDCIGELFIESNFYNEKGLGQFMTPKDISAVVSQLIGAWNNNNKESGSILEPCCGTGSMILNSLKGINQDKISIIINDIDLQMVKICYIQLALNILIFLPNKKIEVKAFNCNIITEYNYPENKLILHTQFGDLH